MLNKLSLIFVSKWGRGLCILIRHGDLFEFHSRAGFCLSIVADNLDSTSTIFRIPVRDLHAEVVEVGDAFRNQLQAEPDGDVQMELAVVTRFHVPSCQDGLSSEQNLY